MNQTVGNIFIPSLQDIVAIANVLLVEKIGEYFEVQFVVFTFFIFCNVIHENIEFFFQNTLFCLYCIGSPFYLLFAFRVTLVVAFVFFAPKYWDTVQLGRMNGILSVCEYSLQRQWDAKTIAIHLLIPL